MTNQFDVLVVTLHYSLRSSFCLQKTVVDIQKQVFDVSPSLWHIRTEQLLYLRDAGDANVKLFLNTDVIVS